MKPFSIHRYKQRPCDFPHKSFAGDYRELIQRNPSEEDLNVFLNLHSTEYLHRVVSAVPALLEMYLRIATGTDQRSSIRKTFSFHIDDLREQSRPVLAVDNTRKTS
jgi:hypothetical protein